MKSNRLVPFQTWRLTFFQAVIFAVFLIFGIRMYELQVIRYDEFQFGADENRFSELPIPARRGAIFDRNDRRLAFNVPAYNVTIIPAQLPSDEADELDVFNRLSALVGVPPTREIAEQAGQFARSIQDLVEEGEGIEPFRPVIVALDVPQLVAMQILEERIYMPGVGVEPVAVREYPTGALTTHIVGYMGPIPAEEALELRALGYNPAFDRIGYEGIERYLEARLAGQRGSILREVDVAGEVVKVVDQVDPAPGENVRLTIDTDLQAFARQALIDQLEELNTSAGRSVSQQGVVIAMNPNTGEILALVSYPSYDNSRFARAIDVEYFLEIAADPLFPLLDKTIKGQYPPGLRLEGHHRRRRAGGAGHQPRHAAAGRRPAIGGKPLCAPRPRGRPALCLLAAQRAWTRRHDPRHRLELRRLLLPDRRRQPQSVLADDPPGRPGH